MMTRVLAFVWAVPWFLGSLYVFEKPLLVKATILSEGREILTQRGGPVSDGLANQPRLDR